VPDSDIDDDETSASRAAREEAHYNSLPPMSEDEDIEDEDIEDEDLEDEDPDDTEQTISLNRGRERDTAANPRQNQGDVGDALIPPDEVMKRLFDKIQHDVGVTPRSDQVFFRRQSESDDKCEKAMQDVMKKRFECIRRIQDEYRDSFDALIEDSEMKARINDVEYEADRCQKVLWYWEVMNRSSRAITAVSLEDGGNASSEPKSDKSKKDKMVLPPSMNIKTLKEMLDDNTLSSYNKCILHIQDCVRNADFRRHGGNIFEKVRNSQKIQTVAWKKMGSIRRFIYENMTESYRPDLWTSVTNTQTVDKIEKYFEDADPPSFPTLVKNRNLFSYDDGVYDAMSGEFHRYPLDAANPVNQYSAARHFEKPFPHDFYRGSTEISHWRDIQTPGVRSVFEYQGLSARSNDEGLRGDSVEDWFYRLVGRMFFQIGEMDDFQVFIYILGRAGTGKSTLAHHAVAGVYEDEDVKQGDNMIEKQFGLWPLADALIVKFTEVKKNFQLDQAQLQEMVSGGCVSVARKNLIAAEKAKWQAHLVMCGNEMPGYQDAQGSLRRRYVIFNMTKKVISENADLKRTMLVDMPKFILKCAMAYRELVVTMQVTGSIWNHLPKHFQDNKDNVEPNSLEAFLRSELVCLEKHTSAMQTCNFKRFKLAYRRFCADECVLHRVDLNDPMAYQYPFADNGILVRKSHREPILRGVSLVFEEQRGHLCAEVPGDEEPPIAAADTGRASTSGNRRKRPVASDSDCD
jgi:hypothetical protein